MAFVFLCLYTVFLIFRPQDFIHYFAGAPFMLIFLASATFLTLFRKDFSFKDVPSWSLLVFLFVMMLSSIANGWTGGTVKILRDFGPIVATYFVYSHELREQGRLRRICLVILACTTLMVIHSIGEAKTGVGWTGARLVEGDRVTYVGIFNDPNDLALMFLVAIPMALLFARQARWKWLALFWLLVAGAHVYGIYLTHSRGAVLSLLLMIAIAGYRSLSMSRFVVASMAALPGVIYFLSTMRSISTSDQSAANRVDAWYTGIQLFRSNPVFGVGWDNFTDYNFITAHNSYILVLAELGILGYIFWSLMIAASGLMVWYASHGNFSAKALQIRDNGQDFQPIRKVKSKPSSLTQEGQMLMYAMIGYLSAAFFLSRSYIVVLYMICGMAVAYYHRALAEDPDIGRVNGKTLTGFLAVFVPASLVFLYLVVRVLL